MNTEVSHVDTQNCGCKVTHYKDEEREPYYEPCLACALTNAGLMLQQAGLRIREERKTEPRPAVDHIQGNRK